MRSVDLEVIRYALAHGVTGDLDKGARLLQPLVDAGPKSTYKLLASLAEVASEQARRDSPTGSHFGMLVEGPDGPVTTDVLPPPVRFAARFVAAWASRDRAGAEALFWDVADFAEGQCTTDLGGAVRAVYEMAVATAGALVDKNRRHRAEQGREK